METVLLFMTGEGGGHRHLEMASRDAAKPSAKHRTAPTTRSVWPQLSPVLRQRDPSLDSNLSVTESWPMEQSEEQKLFCPQKSALWYFYIKHGPHLWLPLRIKALLQH